MNSALKMSIEGSSRRNFPRYGWAGLGAVVVVEILLFAKVAAVGVYFTPLVWTAYILFMDALNFHDHGTSLIVSRRSEFFAMLPWSILCWTVFEAYNLSLHNWTYVGLPENIILRYAGYAWSFATIFPAVLETSEWIEHNIGRDRAVGTAIPLQVLIVSAAAGLAALLTPLLVSPEIGSRLFGLVWIGFFFLLDPINYLLKGKSVIQECLGGNYARPIALALSGLACGVLWEFWNFWATAKWLYSVPLSFAGPKLFEMPLLGYLGFIPFAFECSAMQDLLVAVLPMQPGAPRS